MLAHKIGGKAAIAAKTIALFPQHVSYVEPFFGAGGLFFNKPRAQYNIMNDKDAEVYNLFTVVRDRLAELETVWLNLPIHNALLQHYRKHIPEDPIQRAARFLFMSNYTYLSSGTTLRMSQHNMRLNTRDALRATQKMLIDVVFHNTDFLPFIKSLAFRSFREVRKTFIYLDPPYIGTSNNYMHQFTEEQALQLFDAVIETGCRFAYAEFDNPFIIEQARARKLQVISLGERKNLKNRRTEILITNYKPPITKLF